jgi:hypothetical protein
MVWWQVCEDVAASALCLQCGDFFCPACTKTHRKLNITKHHVLEELASLTPDKLQAKRNHQPCPAHAEEVCMQLLI